MHSGWVNQSQTFRQEIDGGYLWSPKRNKIGRRNPFYEFMREVSPGDLEFSFCDTRIAALGIVSGYCRESPKPEEFSMAGAHWSQIGWSVEVRWQRLANAIRLKNHMRRLRSDLASKYAPLTPEGNGLQSVDLTEIEEWVWRVEVAIPPTERTTLGDARRGQGIFRGNVRSRVAADGLSIELRTHYDADRFAVSCAAQDIE